MRPNGPTRWRSAEVLAAAPERRHRGLRRRLGYGMSLALGLLAVACLTGFGVSAGASTVPSSGDLSGGSLCVSEIPLKSVMALKPDGTQVPAVDGDGFGRVYSYGGPGDDIKMVMPPPGFDPLTATDGELAMYGFEARPSDPALLDHWKSLYVNYHVTVPGPMCVTRMRTMPQPG